MAVASGGVYEDEAVTMAVCGEVGEAVGIVAGDVVQAEMPEVVLCYGT